MITCEGGSDGVSQSFITRLDKLAPRSRYLTGRVGPGRERNATTLGPRKASTTRPTRRDGRGRRSMRAYGDRSLPRRTAADADWDHLLSCRV